MSRQPAAFMSYARVDDDYEDGLVSRFRERLSRAVRAQTGEVFPIFQDREDIEWGQNWQQRIEEALDAVTLLIPIMTPSFFKSTACREEVTRFLRREQQLGRGDLVLPVYYISTPELDDPVQREADELARVLASRQFADWRELRYEPFTSQVVRKALDHFARRMRDSFWKQLPPQPSRPRGSRPAATQATGVEAMVTEPAASVGPVAKTKLPTHVVDAYQRGDFTSIGAAIEAAQPGDRIVVRPGRYQEGLVVDKPLEIVGDGPVEDIEIQARDATALWFKANIGRVANLTIRQTGGEGRWFGVDITQGRLELEGCDIASQSRDCVAIRNGADPRLRRNRIHDSKDASGVLIRDSGLGTLEDNDITGNGGGVMIMTGANPSLRRSQIHDNRGAGVIVWDIGLGMLEDNDITGNGYSGVVIGIGGNPTLRRNQIHDNMQSGVLVRDSGLGMLEDNDITANGLAGVEIRTGGHPTLRGNRINRNNSYAVFVHKSGRGVIEDNDLTGNKRGPWDIAKDSKPDVKRSGNRESRKAMPPVMRRAR